MQTESKSSHNMEDFYYKSLDTIDWCVALRDTVNQRRKSVNK